MSPELTGVVLELCTSWYKRYRGLCEGLGSTQRRSFLGYAVWGILLIHPCRETCCPVVIVFVLGSNRSFHMECQSKMYDSLLLHSYDSLSPSFVNLVYSPNNLIGLQSDSA